MVVSGSFEEKIKQSLSSAVSSLEGRDAGTNGEHGMKQCLRFICSSHTAKRVTCSHVDLEKQLTHSAVLLMYPAVQLPNIE